MLIRGGCGKPDGGGASALRVGTRTSSKLAFLQLLPVKSAGDPPGYGFINLLRTFTLKVDIHRLLLL